MRQVREIESRVADKSARVTAEVEMVVLAPFTGCSPIAASCTGTCWDTRSGRPKPPPGTRDSFAVAHRIRIEKAFAFQKGDDGGWRCDASALGPVDAPPLVPELPGLSPGQLFTLANDLRRAASQTGHLPAAVTVDGQPRGLGSLYGVLAEAYLAATRGDLPTTSRVSTAVWPRYPAGAVALGERQRLCEEDPLVRPGLSTDAIALHTRLQTWTLKPAQRR